METVKHYEPYRELKLGIRIWPQMFQELYHFRELTWRLFVRDFSAKSKQSLLGNIWTVVMPLVTIATFMYLNHAGILVIRQTSMPYPIYALIGLAIWQIFANGLVAGANALVGAGDLISKVSFPREILVIASLAQSILEFGVKLVLIMVFFVAFKFCPSWKIIFMPFMLLPLVSLTLGLSLILSLLHGVMRDTANIVSLALMFLMLLTPVLYPVPVHHHILFEFNFIAPLINAPRDLMAFGHILEPKHFAVSSLISLFILLVSWRMFHLVESKIPERI